MNKKIALKILNEIKSDINYYENKKILILVVFENIEAYIKNQETFSYQDLMNYIETSRPGRLEGIPIYIDREIIKYKQALRKKHKELKKQSSPSFEMHKDDVLKKIPTKRLINHLRSAVAIRSAKNKKLYCDCCGEPLVDVGYASEEEWKIMLKDVKILDETFEKYIKKIKEELSNREHINRQRI